MEVKELNILALDLATRTGWAEQVGKEKDYGSVDFSVGRGESPGIRFLKMRKWLTDKHVRGAYELVIYEQPHHRGGAATMVCVGLACEVQAFAAMHHLDLTNVHTATLKKWATGNGRASKEDMVRTAVSLGYQPMNDDEADAIHLLRYAKEKFGI